MSTRPLITAMTIAAALAPGTAVAATPPGDEFSARVTNPYLPLIAGAKWEYRGREDGKRAHEFIRVSRRVKTISGARCAVVVDRLYKNGKLAEVTNDWYSQRANGDVWYFGEDTKTLKPNGQVESREGSLSAIRPGPRR